jgi:hypothetical protein
MSKKAKKILLKIAVSGGLFGIIFWKVDFGEVLSNFKLLDSGYLPLLLLLLVLNYVVSSVRWKVLLIHKNSEKISLPYLTSLYFIGSFFNNFMPTSIGGDVYKFVTLGRKIKNKADAFTATFMERFTGVIALVLISYFGLVQTLDYWLAQLPESISSNPNSVLLFEGFLFFGFWLGALAAFMSLKFLAKKVDPAKKVYDSLMEYKGKTKVLVIAFLTSFIVQFLAIVTQYLVFTALGVDIPLNYALFIFPVITLASFFVPSLNGLGVQDALYMQLFLAVGISPEVSLIASVVYHLLRLFVSLFGGVLYALGKAD